MKTTSETMLDWRTDDAYLKALAHQREAEDSLKVAEADLRTAVEARDNAELVLSRARSDSDAASARAAITAEEESVSSARARIDELSTARESAKTTTAAAESRARAEAQENLRREYAEAAKELLEALEPCAKADARLRELFQIAAATFPPPSTNYKMYAGLEPLYLAMFEPNPNGNLYGLVQTVAGRMVDNG